MKAQRIPPPIWFVVALVLGAVLHRYLPLVSLVPSPWHRAGIVLAALGVALGVWSAVLFRRVGTTVIPFKESSALVASGPYRHSRNPMYVSMVLVLLGAAIFAGSLSPLVVIAAFVAAIQKLFISTEEAMLAQRFPAEYASYSAKVRRWL